MLNRLLLYRYAQLSVMANSPGLLDTYVHGYERFRALSGFTPAEQEVVLLAVSRENGCTYCVAAHSFIADRMSGVPAAVTDAILDGRPIPDARLAALHDFTRTMVAKRGLPDKADVSAFLAAGYSERQTLEVVLAIAVKTLSNYATCFTPRSTACSPAARGRTDRWPVTNAQFTAGRARKSADFSG